MQNNTKSHKKPNIIKRLWYWFKSPSKMAVGLILIIGIAIGLFGWLGFNYSLEKTNTLEFCAGCHTNDAYKEYIYSPHFQNRSGVQATCPDCHVPHEFVPKIIRKLQASREVYAYMMGKTDTIEKFNSRREHMAQREWARMKANNSQECRNCHNFDNMDFSKQKSVAARMHTQAQENGQSCIDCHKGIAHQLPEMYGEKPDFSNLIPAEQTKEEDK